MYRTHIWFQLCHKQYTLLNDCVPYRVFDALLDEKFSYESHANDEQFLKKFDILTMVTGAIVKDELENIITSSPTKLYVTIHKQKKCIRIQPFQRRDRKNAAAVIGETVKRVRMLGAEIAFMRNPLFDIPVAITTHFSNRTSRTLIMPLCHYTLTKNEVERITRWCLCYKNIPFTIYAINIGEFYTVNLNLFEHEFTKKTQQIDMYCARVHAALSIEYSGTLRRSMFEPHVMGIVKEFL